MRSIFVRVEPTVRLVREGEGVENKGTFANLLAMRFVEIRAEVCFAIVLAEIFD